MKNEWLNEWKNRNDSDDKKLSQSQLILNVVSTDKRWSTVCVKICFHQ